MSETLVWLRIKKTLFLWMERNLHNFGRIFSTASISHFLQTKAKETNVRQFPTRGNFQILNIRSSLRGISFYFPPLEVVHPVARRLLNNSSQSGTLKKMLQFCNRLPWFIIENPVEYWVVGRMKKVTLILRKSEWRCNELQEAVI